jgi:hypothetical protein
MAADLSAKEAEAARRLPHAHHRFAAVVDAFSYISLDALRRQAGR